MGVSPERIVPVSRSTIGPLLRELRRGTGRSQAQQADVLAQLSGRPVTRNEVSRWESQARLPTPHWQRHIAESFDIKITELALAVAASRIQRRGGRVEVSVESDPASGHHDVKPCATGSDEVNRRQLLELGAVTALESARRGLTQVVQETERADLEEWEAVSAEYAHSYLVTPPEILIRQLSGDMPIVHNLIGACPDRLRAGYCRVASQLAVITARTWSSLDEYRQAWRWWRTARVLADASGDLAARMMCRGEEVVMGLYEHRPMSILLDLAAEAVEIGGGTSTRGTVGLWAGIAQANATTGRAVDAVRALNQLERLTEALPSSVTDAADSIYGWPEYRTRHTQSYVYTELGDTRAAGAAQDRALALYPDTLPVSRAQVELHRARCMVLDHDPRGGLAYATEVLTSLPEGFRRDAMVLSVGRKVLNAVPPTARTGTEACVLLDVLQC
jgi:transcriptional regulator with XRE-family HTH domain